MTKAKKSTRATNSLTEHAIIKLMRKHFSIMPNNPVPFGDDVSAVPISETEVAILKTDMLVGKTDIPPSMSLWQAARKAIVMNVSDFAAKGVQPKAALVSLGLSNKLKKGDLEEIAKGLNAAAQEYGTYIIGGDTGEACDLVIAIQLFGTAQKGGLMLRSGAKVGDIVAVTGFFGKPSAGVQVLLKNRLAPDALRKVLVDSVCMPMARLREGLALGHCGGVTSSMDSSDGLAWCLYELGVASGVGIVISNLPVAQEVLEFAKINGLDAAELALYGGEEYELVVTVNPKQWVQAKKAIEAVGGMLFAIGKATQDKRVLLDIDGEKCVIEARGYEHFKS